MSSILLRKLTRKSTINFGKYKKETVDQLFLMKLEKQLISMYFKLSTISFVEDVLIDLGITEEYRIEKPGKDLDLYYKFLDFKFGKKKKPNKKLQVMRKETQSFKKSYLANINHGHK